MMKFIISALVLIVFCSAFSAIDLDKVDMGKAKVITEAKRIEETRPMAFEAIQLMNHLNYVAYTISAYQNAFVLEEEYKQLSNGNLNLQKIPDEDAVEQIQNMLKKIDSLRVMEDRRARFLRKQEEYAQDSRKKMWLKMISLGAVDGLSAGYGSATSTMKGMKKDSGIADVALALSANVPVAIGKACAGQMIGTYLEYQDFQKRLQRESADYQFTYEEEKDKLMHEENLNQLKSQYAMVKRYGIADKYRVTAPDAKELVEVLKSSNKIGVFKQLSHMKDNRESYNYFPMFWCHYAAVALETKNEEVALEACKNFEETSAGLFIRNQMEAQVAMVKVTAMVSLSQKDGRRYPLDLKAVEDAIKTIKKFNYNSANVDMGYFCASVYNSVLKQPMNAIEVLQPLIYRLDNDYQNKLVSYCDLLTTGADEVAQPASVPESYDLLRCHLLLRDILESQNSKALTKTLQWICTQRSTAALEKLYLVGKTRVDDLWKLAQDDVAEIELEYVNDPWRNSFEAYVPLRWFALGEMHLNLDLLVGESVKEHVEEEFAKRSIVRRQDKTYVRVVFACRKRNLAGVDSVRMRMPHKSWPLVITHLPIAGWNILDGSFSQDRMPFQPFEVEFMGMKKSVQGDVKSVVSANLKTFDQCEKSESLKNRLSRQWTESWGGLGGPLALRIIYNEVGRLMKMKEDELAKWVTMPCVPASEWVHRKYYEKAKDPSITTRVIQYPRVENSLNDTAVYSAAVKDNQIVVNYTNTVPYRYEVKIQCAMFNEYGAQICALEADSDWKPMKGGEIILKLPLDTDKIREPAYVFFEWSKRRGYVDKALDKWDRW